jgi:hypothetical protein
MDNPTKSKTPAPGTGDRKQSAQLAAMSAIVDGTLRAVVVALIVAAAGCTAPARQPERPPDMKPPVHVSDDTWLQVDGDIAAASAAAKVVADGYARDAMANWKRLVQARTERDFIPWYTSFWTQRWLAMKVAWYKLSGDEGSDPTVARLSAYLQAQYRDRVLDPAAREINPDAVREQATQRYVRYLGTQLQEIRQRHGVPPDQFDRRLGDIPAIAPEPPAAPTVSLHELVHAKTLARLPAYAALTEQVRKAAGSSGNGPSDARISAVAKRASDKLAARLIASGSASAAAAAVGGGVGAIVSFGSAVLGAAEYEKDRPFMEAQLRETLDLALEDMWLDLVESQATGVMAEVHLLSRQIENGLVRTLTHPAEPEPPPQGVPLSGEPLSGAH